MVTYNTRAVSPLFRAAVVALSFRRPCGSAFLRSSRAEWYNAACWRGTLPRVGEQRPDGEPR